MAGLIFLIIIVGIFIFLQYYNPHHWYISESDTPPDSLVFYFVEIMDHIGFTTVFWTLLGLYVFYQWDNRKKKRK